MAQVGGAHDREPHLETGAPLLVGVGLRPDEAPVVEISGGLVALAPHERREPRGLAPVAHDERERHEVRLVELRPLRRQVPRQLVAGHAGQDGLAQLGVDVGILLQDDATVHLVVGGEADADRHADALVPLSSDEGVGEHAEGCEELPAAGLEARGPPALVEHGDRKVSTLPVDFVLDSAHS